MPRKEVFNLTIDVGANISQAQSAAKSLQQAFAKVNLTDSLKKGLDKTFGDLEKELNNFSSMTSKPFTNMKDIEKAEKSYEKIVDLFYELSVQGKTISGMDPSKFLPKETIARINTLQDSLKKVRSSINDTNKDIVAQNKAWKDASQAQLNYQQKISDANSKLKSLQGSLGASTKKIKDLKEQQAELTQQQADFLNNGGSKSDPQYQQWGRELQALQKEINGAISNQSSYQKQIAETKSQLNQYNNAEIEAGKAVTEHKQKLDQLQENLKNSEGLTQLREEIAKIQGVSLDEVSTDADELEKNIANLSKAKLAKIVQELLQIGDTSNGLVEASGATKGLKEALSGLAQQGGELNEVEKEVQRLGEQVKQFFSIGNTIQLFKRAVRDAMATVKELDATMTETATVTDFSISDMWEQLPRYTDEANKLGTSINSLYKATTLYYQQGLDTNEAMALGIETIKMARVANMDAALATDLMTAALRGFNMELNEMSAVRINDVYSELAAVTAADTDEIGIAISKTASIAHSANMEFETTAAFLSQIIETTREAPETAGTAMKTIIARFSEVKKLYSEGQILGTDEEGEAININKIQEALRTVGIDMTKFFVGAEGLDDVLLRLAEKWDTLDVATQRYIATQAAGSRQQSRFLAMMSDYDRTMELVDAAYDSAGSGQAQFEKTLDSMQAKLTELKNAWDQFVMGLANNEILKTGVDILTSILSTINDIISAVSGGNGLVKAITSLGASFLTLRTGAKIFGEKGKGGGFIGSIFKALRGKDVTTQMSEAGQQAAKSFGTGFNGFISSGFDSKGFGESIKKGFTSSIQGIKNFFVQSKFDKEQFLGQFYGATPEGGFGEDFFQDQMKNVPEFKKAVQDAGYTVEEVDGKFKVLQEDSVGNLRAIGVAATALGGLLIGLGDNLEKKGNVLGTVIKNIGTTITIVGGAITLLGGSFTKAGIEIGKAGAIAKLGWAEFIPILLAIVAIVGLVTAAINNTPEKRLERAKQRAQEAQQAAQEAQQAYDDLLSNKNKYTELEDKVRSLTKGTEEWKDAVAELNTKVTELAQNYEGLELEYDENGVLSIKNWNELENQAKEKRDTTLYESLTANLDVARKSKTAAESSDFNRASEIRDEIARLSWEGQEGFGVDNSERIKQLENELKTLENGYSSAVNSAEKEIKASTKNLFLAFMPDEAIEKDIANEYGNVLTEIFTATGKKAEDFEQEELVGKLNASQYSFENLTDEEKALLTGDFSKISSTEQLPLSDNLKDLADQFDIDKDKLEEFIKLQNEANKRSFNQTRRNLATAGSVRTTEDADAIINEFGRETADKLGQNMVSMGPSQADQYLNTWKKIFKDKGKDIAEALLDFDVTDFRSLTNLTDYMHEQGFNKDDAEEYWRAMVNGVENFTVTYGQIASWAEGIKESMKGVTEMVERLESGKLTADDLTAFENAGLNTNNRLLTADGYKVFGVDSQEARRALNQANAEKAQRDLDTLNEMGGGISQLDRHLEDERSIQRYAEMLNLTKQKDETEEEFVKRIQDEWARTREIAEETNDYAQAAIHTADEWAALGGTDKQIRYATMQEASDAGLDVNELLNYSQVLQQVHNLEQSVADRIALDNMKMNASIKELSSNWNEWKAGLESGKDTAEYSAALDSLRKNMQSMLGITSNLSEEFLTNADNMDLMARAAEGDGDAIDELRKKAATEIALGVNYDEDGIDQLESNLLNALEGFDPNIEIGTTLEDANLTQAFQELIDKGYASADEVNKALEGIGFEPEIKTEEIPIDGSSAQRIVANGGFWKPTADMMGTEWVPIKNETELQGYVGQTATLPIINGKKTKYKGSSKSTVNGSNKKGSSGGKKGGGGGGGSSKKQNNWKNPYDKYYNLTEKINEALRTREKIERDYDRILKRRERTAAELLKNSAQEIANLRQEIVYQQRLQAGRREQIENLAKERYDNGDQRTTFEQMGVTKYANYNFDTQTIEIDWAAIEAVRDEELGKAIEAYVGRLEELQGQYEDTQTTIEDMEDQIWEINQRGKEEYLSFESRIIDALINADQKLIDDLSAKFDSINEANSRVLSSMQESIDLERQIRDNTKTEDDIASKEARLAYLRRDTSGANQMEIMKLEQDLADARQNYSDQLIDQGMQKLSDENEKASQQRQEQIDIMQAIHDWTVESGGFNATAERLINETAAAGEVTEEVKKLLQDNEGWTSMTKFAGEDWMTKLANEYKAAMEGMSNFKVDDAKTKHTSANNTMSVIDEEGKNAADVWFDNTLQRWVDKSGNLYDIYWDATANEGKGAYRYSNKQAKDTTDPNAWLKDYFDKMIAALGDKDSGTPSSGSGGNSGNSGSSGTKPPTTSTDHGYTIKKGDGSKLTKGGFSSKKAAQEAAEYKITNQLNSAQAAYNKTYQDYLKGKATTSSRNNALALLNNWKWAKITNVYKTGGLNTQTGLAWLDGTASHPELVLNARDTENFIQLKDILSDMGSLDKLQNGGDNYYNFDIKVDQLANDYDVDKLIGKIKNEIDKDARYRNVNSINFIR